MPVNERVKQGIKSLIDTFILDLPDDENAAVQERVQALIENEAGSQGSNDHAQVADLIKKRFWREHNDPEAAVQFGNLYSRFLSIGILSRKQSILWLLYKLAEQEEEEGRDGVASLESAPTPAPAPAPQNGPRTPRLHNGRRMEPREAGRVEKRSSAAQTERDEAADDDRQATAPDKEVEEPSGNHVSDGKGAGEEEPTDGTAVTELELLRDLPFTLQGLSSTNLQFDATSTLVLPRTLSLPMISILHRLAEPSLLYRNLSEFIQSPHRGLVSQSLRAAISIELRSYLGLIATLEGEIRRTITAASRGEGGAPRDAVTLKRCVVWTRDATMGLRLMSLMAEESRSKAGGQLISLIHSFTTSYGDPFVNSFAERMLTHLTKPFYDMVQQWIYDGELNDPYREFFVIKEDSAEEEIKSLGPRRLPASSVWESKYKLDKRLVPSIVTDDLARKVFLIGKSLNFIRYGCSDSTWVDTYAKDSAQELRYGDTAGLEASIDRAHQTTMARLIHLMDAKFGLFEHLRALKKYLLLGQGDFVALLMESLASNLDRPAGSQYRHTLTAQLDHAIRGSSAAADSAEVRRRLDARLLELSHGDIGWDVFTLEYKVEAPVDVVITPWAARQYLKVFNFLWRAKRVEFALATAWRRLMTGARGVLAAAAGPLAAEWKRTRGGLAEMIHFVSQLQNYILFEVIEASWNKLQAAMARPDASLDDLIAAHTTYLNDITHKGLLGAAARPSSSTAPGAARDDSFMAQLHHLLKTILAYKDAVDGLFSHSVAEFTRSQASAAQASSATAAPRPGGGPADADADLDSPLLTGQRQRRRRDPPARDTDSPAPSLGAPLDAPDDQVLPALQTRLRGLAGDFRARLAVLLGDLLQQSDPDIKFLGMNMNFNDVYRPQRRKRREKERERAEGGKAVA